MKKKICIISLSKINIDGRVLRQIDFLSQLFNIAVIGFGKCPEKFLLKQNIQWLELSETDNPFFRILSTLFSRFIMIPLFPKKHKATKIARNIKCDAYLANNWDALPAAAIAAEKFSSKVVLDIHESYDAWYWGFNKSIIKKIFKKYSKNVHASTTVVKALAYQHNKFGFNPIVIRNIPILETSITDKKPTNPNKIRLISHGVASHSRRTDILIQALALSDHRYELHLMFTNINSPYVKKLKKLAAETAADRVFFHPPCAPHEIVDKISLYDIGFFPLFPTNYNYLIALPNKLFEFISAGLAICIGPSSSMAEIVNEFNCGLVAENFHPKTIADLLNRTSAEQWNEMKLSSLNAGKTLNANFEMKKLLTLFEGIFYE